MRAIWCLLVAASLAGCWSPRYFSPRENVNGTGPDGEAAAVYEVDRGQGDGADAATRGELRVFSQGARARFTDDDEEVVDLHVGFEIENNGSEPFELDTDSVQLEELMVDGYLQQPLAPHSVAGSGRAAPGTTSRVDFVFRPATTYPRSVDSFSVRFAMVDADGARVGQVTPFSPERRRWRSAGYVSPAWGWGPWWGAYGWYGGWGPVGVWGPGLWYGGFCR